MARKGKIVECAYCKKEIFRPLSKLKRNKYFFCSKDCTNTFKSRANNVEVTCHTCGKKVERVLSRVKKTKHFTFCSPECQKKGIKGINFSGFFKKGNKGPKCINYKNGTQVTNGYISVLAPDHPHTNRRGYVYEHRLVMEKRLGRYLTPEEVVHHIDFNKKNNADENLMLFATDSEHRRHHYELKKQGITAKTYGRRNSRTHKPEN